MRKRIYLAIAEALKRAQVAQFISLWNEDTDELEKVTATEFPAVYVEFTPTQWRQQANRVKSATWRLNIHILTQTLATPEDGSPNQDVALEAFDQIEAVIDTVQGISGEGFNRLQHVETVPDHAHGEIQHDIEGFICEVTDTSAVHPRTTIRPIPVIKPAPAGK